MSPRSSRTTRWRSCAAPRSRWPMSSSAAATSSRPPTSASTASSSMPWPRSSNCSPAAKETVMPWFPDFASAVELSRQQTRAAAAADPVSHYFTLLNTGDTHAIEDVCLGEVTLYDPLAGRIHGHRELGHFVQHNE